MGTTGNQYDLGNRITKACDALGNCTTYGPYDADDNLTKVTSGAGIETDYKYDNLNRRIEIDYGVVSGNPTSKVNLTYDLGDRLTKAVDSKAGTITRQFGASNTSLASGLDFISQEGTPQGSVSYTPNAGGLRTAMTVVAGTATQPQVTYNYDAADKLTSVSQSGSTTTKQFTDAAGRLKTLTLPNNLAVTYAYDKDSHVTSLTYGSLGTLTYGYDADGRRTSVGGGFGATTIPAPQTFSYNADNSLKTEGSYGAINDADGNLLCIGSTCPWYSYDERGHLQQARSGSSTFDFSYDAFGRRYEINFGGLVVTCYVYDGLNPVATTYDCASSLFVTSYLGGLGLDELFMVNNGSNESFLRDALNSTIALTNSSGSIVDQTTYDPYGNTTDSAPSSASAFEFTGSENDQTFGGLYYMRARYYSPQLARFISRDPAGLAGGVNLYAYAGDDPIDFSDPTGTDNLEGPGDVCSACIPHGPGGFVPPQEAMLVNQDGLDNAVVQYYDGSQNGGGQRDPVVPVQMIGVEAAAEFDLDTGLPLVCYSVGLAC